jgi:hypothetical protein
MATPEGAAYMGGEIIDGTGYVVDNSELEPGEAWTPLDFEPAALGFKKALDQPKAWRRFGRITIINARRAFIVALTSAHYATVRSYLGNPLVAIPMLLLVLSGNMAYTHLDAGRDAR